MYANTNTNTKTELLHTLQHTHSKADKNKGAKS